MPEEHVGSQGTNSFWGWPIHWVPAVRRAVALGQHPDVLLTDPQFVAHRVLDTLASLAFEVHHGAPDASSAFVSAIRKLIGAAPWVLGDSLRGSGDTANPEKAHDSSDPHLEESAQEGVQTSSEDTLIDNGGVIALLAVAARLAGRDGAKAILELSAAAIAAEQWLPGLSHSTDAGYRADIASLGGTITTVVHQRSAGERASQTAPFSIGAPVWQRLSTLAHTNAAAANRMRCLKLFHELTDSVVPAPQPEGPVSWTTGIDHVQVIDPCDASPLLTIHGQGFGIAAPGVGVVAAMWDEKTSAVAYRTVPVASWSDTEIVVKLGSNAVGGVVAFADIAFISTYNSWADGENQRLATAMHDAGCPGYGPPASPVIWSHWSETPAFTPAATYLAGMPRIVAEITLEPVGKAPDLWNKNTVHLGTGQAFWILWKTANAESAVLRASGTTSQLLVAAGYPASGVPGTSGSARFVAPSSAAVLEFTIEAINATCGAAQLPLRLVVTGPSLQPVRVEVQQSLPGGEFSVLAVNGIESLNPAGGQSIPLVAQKRSVARIDWWTAFPQIPAGESLTAEASLHVSGPALTWPGVTLRPGVSTANPPPAATDQPVSLQAGRPFSSVLEYEQWITQSVNNNPATFDVVLPAQLCVGQVTLEATVRARNQNGRLWTATATKTVEFHPRRRVRIRYRPWGSTVNLPTPIPGQPPPQPLPAPTDAQCEAALRGAGSLLPIPDPEIVRLPGPPYEAGINNTITEALWFEKTLQFVADVKEGKNPKLADEIWLAVGPVGAGGFALPTPDPSWTATVDATARTTAHEIGHLFRQDHLNLCGLTGADDPALFPDNANVNVTGWDMWNHAIVRGAVDIMMRTYCPEPTWTSPERWRRIFLRVGP